MLAARRWATDDNGALLLCLGVYCIFTRRFRANHVSSSLIVLLFLLFIRLLYFAMPFDCSISTRDLDGCCFLLLSLLLRNFRWNIVDLDCD